MRLGGIEAGGTKWNCVVAEESGEILASLTVPTTTPDQTIGRAEEFMREVGPIEALGLGAFGPVDVRPASPTFGQIASTPKPGWSHTDVLTPLGNHLKVPIGLETDVNVAALGEGRWGAGVGLRDFVYMTVGTGVGAGVVLGGQLIHGLLHPEVGHMRLPHNRARDPFGGSCPFHSDCLEGLASGEAIRLRSGAPAESVEDHHVWELETDYLAAALVNLTYVLSPQRLILGGGVMSHPGLIESVRARFGEMIGGYPDAPGVQEHLKACDYIVPPALGSRAGVLGAIALAHDVATGRHASAFADSRLLAT
jgi:fructokinase